MRARPPSVVVVLLALAGAACDGPTQPSASHRVTLSLVRYVRTRPVVAPAAAVSLLYTIPDPEDYLGRSQIGGHLLRAVDDVTFVDDLPHVVPIDQECTFYIEDLAVSPYHVGTDIYVNGTLIRVRLAGNYEFGLFKVDRNGRVY